MVEVNEKWFAFVYLENSDQNKYGSLINNLASQKALSHDQYPQTVAKANSMLGTQKLDNCGHKQNNNKQKQQHQNNTTKDKDKSPVLSFAQLEGSNKCYCCGKLGYKSPD